MSFEELINEITNSLQKNPLGTDYNDIIEITGSIGNLKYIDSVNGFEFDENRIINILTKEYGGCMIGSSKFHAVNDKIAKLAKMKESLEEVKEDFKTGDKL